MFWKQDKQVSLSTQLLLLYGLSTMMLVIAIFFFLYPSFNQLITHIHGDEATFILARCYQNLIISLLISSLGAFILGKIIANRGLKRLDEFSKSMEKITIDSLHERVKLEGLPKELKGLGSNFNIMLNRLETSFSKISQFSSDISHELRHSLQHLKGMTEKALERENLSEQCTDLLVSYMDEYQNLTRLTDQLLFLSRTEEGQIRLNRDMIQVEEEMLACFEFYKPLADEKKITMNCIGHSTGFLDASLFKRLITNLLSNAVYYTPSNGYITVTIQNCPDKRVSFTIRNTGPGIASEHLPKLFDRFYRVDSSRSHQTGGLGLGLSIVKSIVDLHQGAIEIDSALNQGVTVYVVL